MGAFLVKTAVFMKRMYQKFFSEKRSGDGFDKIFRSEKKYGENLQYSKFVRRNKSL